MSFPVITIDGPSASGKSSVSRDLAARLGWNWVSTGAFYRGLAYAAQQKRLDSKNVSELLKLCSDPVWSVDMQPHKTAVMWQGKDVSEQVFSEALAEKASQISQLQEVRKALLLGQRQCAERGPGLVAEGRDCGTVVFPKAVLKIYLTASQEARAERRAREQGIDVGVIKASQTERDQQDSTRTAAPLQVPADGRILDTNHLSLKEAVDNLYQWSREALGHS